MNEDTAGVSGTNCTHNVQGATPYRCRCTRPTWGERPPTQADRPATTGGREPYHETLTQGSEQISADQNLRMLERSFDRFHEAQRADRELVARNFDSGKTGRYVARSKTLLEMVRGAVGRP